jgi:hypothetical protein
VLGDVNPSLTSLDLTVTYTRSDDRPHDGLTEELISLGLIVKYPEFDEDKFEDMAQNVRTLSIALPLLTNVRLRFCRYLSPPLWEGEYEILNRNARDVVLLARTEILRRSAEVDELSKALLRDSGMIVRPRAQIFVAGGN